MEGGAQQPAGDFTVELEVPWVGGGGWGGWGGGLLQLVCLIYFGLPDPETTHKHGIPPQNIWRQHPLFTGFLRVQVAIHFEENRNICLGCRLALVGFWDYCVSC